MSMTLCDLLLTSCKQASTLRELQTLVTKLESLSIPQHRAIEIAGILSGRLTFLEMKNYDPKTGQVLDENLQTKIANLLDQLQLQRIVAKNELDSQCRELISSARRKSFG